MSDLFDAAPTPVHQIPLHLIHPDPEQPRKTFDPEALQELSASIRAIGVIQPILVREETAGVYRILYGERRWRAAKLAQLDTIPCLIQCAFEEKLARWVMQCSENAHHRDLGPLEYMDTIKEMRAQGISSAAIAQALGKRTDWVRGHELAATPAYRSLFETGRLRSVDVLLIFRSLPDGARRDLLDEGGLITSTRCARMREKSRLKEARKAARLQINLPMIDLVHSTPGNSENINPDHALPVKKPFNIPAHHPMESIIARSIVTLALPSTWIAEAGGVEVIRRAAMAALNQIRSAGWRAA